MIIIRNYDVSSYYPHLMTICGYTSRSIPNPQIYADMLEERMVAKKTGDKAKNAALKLVANTTYGAMLNKYNDLNDPLMGRSVCITGQLFLLELAEHLMADCKSLFVVQLNTDGIMVGFDDSEYSKVLEIVKEWEQRTGFEMEEDKIKAIYQKDVNNYIEEGYEGELKIKGGYLVRGLSKAGAFNINNTMPIVAKAITDYFTKDIPPEQTINECNELLQFQTIAKAGSKYKSAYHLVDGEKVPVQKVNRVYASKDDRYGKLYKVKAENGQVAKIESLPEHCIIDNDNHLTIEAIDKSYYIDVAKKRINDFLGIDEKKTKGKSKMATKKETTTATESKKAKTFLEKLMIVQDYMDSVVWEKDGTNTHQKYHYIKESQYKKHFKAARKKAGLLWECECVDSQFVPEISDKMHLIVAKFIGRFIDPTTGECKEYHFQGSGADNGDKALYKAYTGGLKFFLANTYLVAEGNDPENDEDAPTPSKPKTKKAPATETERTDIKEKLTDTDGPATELEIEGLKKALKKLRELDDSQEQFIAGVAKLTNGFKEMTKAQHEKIMQNVLDRYNKAKENN